MRSTWRAGIALMAAFMPAPAPALSVGPLIAESVDSGGQPVHGFCSGMRLSVTGRHLTFVCNQPELLREEQDAPQSGPATHVFVRDRLTGHTEIADVDDQGRYHAQSARDGFVSADGRYVVFESASPLIPAFDWPAISPGRSYVYLRDTLGDTTELIARMGNGDIPPYAMWQGGMPDFDRGEILLSGQTDLLTGEFTPQGSSLFVRNWRTGAVERVTVAKNGAPSHGGPGVLSADGRYVVFLSSADDLTDDNPRGLPNLFIHDRHEQTTRRLSFPAGGGEFETPFSTDGSLHLTADGRYLVFASTSRELVEDGQTLPYSNVYLMNLTDGAVMLASTGSRGQRPDGASVSGRISADGRYLAFATRATNLLDTPQRPGVYVKDRLTGALVDTSASLGEMSAFGLPDLDLSADGSTLAFTWIDDAYPKGDPRRQQMYSTTLQGAPPLTDPVAVPSTARPAGWMLTGLLAWIGALAMQRDGRPRLRESSASRRSVAILGLVVMTAASGTRALEVGAPVLESYGSDGQIVGGFCWTSGVSPNGRYLIVTCNYAGLRNGDDPGAAPRSDPPRHAYLRDRHTGRIDMLDLDNQGQHYPYHGRGLKASFDGRYVVFVSNAPLTPETDWTIFDFGQAFAYLRDVHQAMTHLIARRADGAAPELSTSALDANFPTHDVLLKGRTDLIGGGTTSGENLYVRNWETGAVELVSATPDGHAIEGYMWEATMSADGRFVAFVSAASNLTDDNPAGFVNIFLRDRRMQRTRRLTFPVHGGEFSEHIQPYNLQLTRDNRYLVFTAYGRELGIGGSDLLMRNAYLMDLSDGRVEPVSIGTQGQLPNSYTEDVRISADGRYLAFATRATNLLDTPQPPGVYVKDRWTGRMVNATATLNGGPDYYPASFDLSEDGSTLVVNWTDTTFIQGDPRRLRMYSIALRGEAPTPRAQAVPALSDAFRLILLAALAVTAWVLIGRRRARSRTPGD